MPKPKKKTVIYQEGYAKGCFFKDTDQLIKNIQQAGVTVYLEKAGVYDDGTEFQQIRIDDITPPKK